MNTHQETLNQSYPAQADVLSALCPGVVEVTGDLTVTDEHLGKILRYVGTADGTITLPEILIENNGFRVKIENQSAYVVTVKPAGDNDRVWKLQNGKKYGVDMPDMGTLIDVRASYAVSGDHLWNILYKVGGRVMIEGLGLDISMNTMLVHGLDESAAGTQAFADERTKKHSVLVYNGVNIPTTAHKFEPGSYNFNGTDEYLRALYSSDWNLFGTQVGKKIIAGWILFDTLGSIEYFLSQPIDATHGYRFWKQADDSLRFRMEDGTSEIDMSGGTVTSGWHHVALIVDDDIAAIYLNGSQICYATSWDIKTFSANLYLGCWNGNYHDGRLQNWLIAFNDPFNGNPNIGLTDTLSNWNQPFIGVM